ncbi:hypothetical protein WJU23_17470 [Prosthecobacter sp. SYSU 5D2]|uniref:hypothetical protein n=1 Tax=Prosthecobacter sp. SYSU 5D2 TaxID=3134134 RepID=UPI0031FE656A
MKTPSYFCPVCGYARLKELPRSASGGPSYEICPACGFQFGVSDDDDEITYEQWRADWVDGGMEWTSLGIPKPRGWEKQKVTLLPKEGDA